jgi:hypothetical protein
MLGTIAMRAVAVLAFALVLACGPAGAAHSKRAPKPAYAPMQVHVVRSAQAGCEPQCLQWIAAQGKIVTGSALQFGKVVGQLGDRKLPVLIDSAGGSVDDALAIGRLIRAKGLHVAVSRTEFTPCAPADAACRKAKTGGELRGLPKAQLSKCASACAFLFAGGMRRFVGEGTSVGVHQVSATLRWYHVFRRPSFGGPIETRKIVSVRKIGQKHEFTQNTYANLRQYFAEMGIGEEIMPMIQSTPNNKIHWLTAKELESTRLATHFLNGEQLLSAASTPDPASTSAPVPEIAGYRGACEKLGICEPGVSSSKPLLNVPTGVPLPMPAQGAK